MQRSGQPFRGKISQILFIWNTRCIPLQYNAGQVASNKVISVARMKKHIFDLRIPFTDGAVTCHGHGVHPYLFVFLRIWRLWPTGRLAGSIASLFGSPESRCTSTIRLRCKGIRGQRFIGPNVHISEHGTATQQRARRAHPCDCERGNGIEKNQEATQRGRVFHEE